VPAKVSPDDFEKQEAAAAETNELKATIRSLLRQNVKLKASKAELIEAVYRAAKEAAQGLEIVPVPVPIKDRRRGGAEIAVPLYSDLQLGKITPDYNSEVAEERMHLYADKITRLVGIQRNDHPVRECHVAALGDIVEGEDIFPGQAHLIDATLYDQILVSGRRISIDFFRRLLGEFDRVRVTWVIGNHGRIGRKGVYDPETNADRMLGRLVAYHFEDTGEKRISFEVPDGPHERNWYAIIREGAWSALAIHGDQIRGQYGMPWYGFQKKINSWAAGAIREPFGDVLMGHFHQSAKVPLNTRDVYVNGSLESYNTYAQENLAAMSDPAQWLLFVDPEKGRVTAPYQVALA
jgi:hypothetical protein